MDAEESGCLGGGPCTFCVICFLIWQITWSLPSTCFLHSLVVVFHIIFDIQTFFYLFMGVLPEPQRLSQGKSIFRNFIIPAGVSLVVFWGLLFTCLFTKLSSLRWKHLRKPCVCFGFLFGQNRLGFFSWTFSCLL